jgi:hypothetical protein
MNSDDTEGWPPLALESLKSIPEVLVRLVLETRTLGLRPRIVGSLENAYT